MKFIYFILPLFVFTACKQVDEDISAQKIIDSAIEKAGGERFEKAEIHFQFRDISYSSRREGGRFRFTRTLTDSVGEATDILTNEGMQRFRGGQEDPIHDTLKIKYANSVNSVQYFLQLPYGLNDPAVQKELLGQDTINGETYYEIQVTFKEEEGGADHEDEYLYWIHKEDFTVDYLAYRFYVDEGGIRFREAYNPRKIKGLRFVDYENYKYGEGWRELNLQELDDLFEAGKLPHVSTIETDIQSVRILE